jgi:hypothetical protein
MRYRVVLLAASLAGVLLLVSSTSSASGASNPGWTLAKASAYIESTFRLADPELVTLAQEHLRVMKQLGGSYGISEAEQDLKIAKAGYSVDRASCVGIKPAPGGYVSFKCKLGGSIDLGFTLKSVGVWKRLPTGTWRYVESSRSYGGYGPSWWKNP